MLSVSPQRSLASGPHPSPPQSLGSIGKDHNLFDIYKDSSASPQDSPMILRGVLDQGSKENLFLGEETPDTSSLASGDQEEKKKKKKKRLLGRSKSEKRARSESVKDPEQESTGSPPPLSPTSNKSKKEAKKKKEKDRRSAVEQVLEKELVLAKTTCADYANQLEVKALELKQALQREAFLIRELKQVRAELEARVSRSDLGGGGGGGGGRGTSRGRGGGGGGAELDARVS